MNTTGMFRNAYLGMIRARERQARRYAANYLRTLDPETIARVRDARDANGSTDRD